MSTSLKSTSRPGLTALKKRMLPLRGIIALLIVFTVGAVYPEQARGAIHLGSSNTATLSNGLVGYWPLDGATTNWRSNTTRDLSGQGNTGTLISMSTTTSPVAGKIGGALSFAGSQTMRTSGSSPVTTTSVTSCAWLKPAVTSRGDVVTVWSNGLGGSQFDLLYGLTPGKVQFYVSAGAGANGSGTSNTTMSVGAWYFICGTYDGSNIKVYVNGNIEVTTALTLTLSSGSGQPVIIGNNSVGDGPVTGTIDDVRIYNRALGATEIKQLYTLGTANAGHANTVSISNGLVGYWPLDGVTTNWRTNTTQDISGQGSTGQLVSMSTTTSPVAGKIGQALNINGSNYITTSNISFISNNTQAHSIFAWVKPTNASTDQVITEYGESSDANWATGLEIKGGNLRLVFDGLNGGSPIDSGLAVPSGKWSFVGVVRTPTTITWYVNGASASTADNTSRNITSPNKILIGVGVQSGVLQAAYTGLVDDVRYYNRSLGAAEVKQLYNIGAVNVAHSNAYNSNGLVGYWPLDGATTNWRTNTTQDLSGNGNTGTLISMSTTTSPVAGKIGQALNFNGTNSDVKITSSSLDGLTVLTACVWAYPYPNIPDGSTFVSKQSSVGWDMYYINLVNSTGGGLGTSFTSTGFANWSDYTSPIVLFNKWNFICVEQNGDDAANMKLFVNAVQYPGSVNNNGTRLSDAGNPLHIGNNAANNPVSGKIDDVRIYNRALGAAEIKQLYNSGR